MDKLTEKELLKIYIADIEHLIKDVHEQNIDVYEFFDEMVHQNEFFKTQINK